MIEQSIWMKGNFGWEHVVKVPSACLADKWLDYYRSSWPDVEFKLCYGTPEGKLAVTVQM